MIREDTCACISTTRRRHRCGNRWAGDIVGMLSTSKEGQMVSISGDGTRVASIGAPLRCGQSARVEQRFTDVDAHERLLHYAAIAVSMSRDGTKILVLWSIGEYLSFYALSSEGSWSKVGSDMTTANWAPGYSNAQAVAISGNGEYFVLGYPYNQGKVVAFSLVLANSPIFQQHGNDIFGESNADRATLGSSVAISDDGSRIVAGAPGQQEPDGVFTSSMSGSYAFEPYVRVYELDESTNSWDQLGGDLTMGQQQTDLPGYYPYYFGRSLDMSDDGTVIAIRSVCVTGTCDQLGTRRPISSDSTPQIRLWACGDDPRAT